MGLYFLTFQLLLVLRTPTITHMRQDVQKHVLTEIIMMVWSVDHPNEKIVNAMRAMSRMELFVSWNQHAFANGKVKSMK